MSLESQATEYIFAKVLLIGDSNTGKSEILVRCCDANFNSTTEKFIATIGVDFKMKTLEIENQRIKLQIWDTAGQERFRTITSSYYRGASAILIVFNCFDASTFQGTQKWIEESERYCSEGIDKILVGHLLDVNNDSVIPMEERQVSEEEGKALSEKYGIPYIEVNPRTNYRINELFSAVATSIKRKRCNEKPYQYPNFVPFEIKSLKQLCCEFIVKHPKLIKQALCSNLLPSDLKEYIDSSKFKINIDPSKLKISHEQKSKDSKNCVIS